MSHYTNLRKHVAVFNAFNAQALTTWCDWCGGTIAGLRILAASNTQVVVTNGQLYVHEFQCNASWVFANGAWAAA